MNNNNFENVLKFGDCELYAVIAMNYLNELKYEPICYKYELTKGEKDYHYYIQLQIDDSTLIIDNDNYVYRYNEYISKFGVKNKKKCSKKEIKTNSEYFNDPINSLLYFKELGLYESFEDAKIKIQKSINEKLNWFFLKKNILFKCKSNIN